MAKFIRIFAALVLLGAAGLSAACNVEKPEQETTESTAVIKHVDAQQASNLINDSQDIVVLDIRTPDEFADGHIKDALLIDFKSPDFAKKISKLDKNTPYLIHCHSGGRSTKSLDVFTAQGFTNITHLDGGIKGWKAAKLPLEN